MCPCFSLLFKLVISCKGKRDNRYVLQYWNKAMLPFISHLTSKTYALRRTPKSFVDL